MLYNNPVYRTLLAPKRLNSDDPAGYLRRYCLYHFGSQWYMVQLWSLTGLPVAEQRFLPNGKDQVVDVLTYTRECWKANPPAWVRELRPESPAILYRCTHETAPNADRGCVRPFRFPSAPYCGERTATRV